MQHFDLPTDRMPRVGRHAAPVPHAPHPSGGWIPPQQPWVQPPPEAAESTRNIPLALALVAFLLGLFFLPPLYGLVTVVLAAVALAKARVRAQKVQSVGLIVLGAAELLLTVSMVVTF